MGGCQSKSAVLSQVREPPHDAENIVAPFSDSSILPDTTTPTTSPHKLPIKQQPTSSGPKSTDTTAYTTGTVSQTDENSQSSSSNDNDDSYLHDWRNPPSSSSTTNSSTMMNGITGSRELSSSTTATTITTSSSSSQSSGMMKRATSMACMNGSGDNMPKKPKGSLKRASSLVGLDEFIETRKGEGVLASNMVHIEVPFGKPIEEVYDGVHDGPVLGSGISGVVRRCTHKKTLVPYAVKCLDLGLIASSGLQQLREEIFIMCQLDHPNIVRLEEVYESRTEIYLVMELCLGGELFDRLDEQPDYHYTEQQCARLVKQMLSAVRYLHSRGIVHRDLKLENFLFQSHRSDSELKMIDFGLSKHFEKGEVQNQAVGTPYTVAPEVIKGSYDERCDVWAMGVITYLLLSGDPPFGGCGGPETLLQVRSNIIRGQFEFEPREIWEGVSNQAKDFIRSLLVTDPTTRPTAQKAQKSIWLQEWAVKETRVGSNLLNPDVVKSLVTFKEYGDMRKLLCEVLSFTLLPDQIQDLRKEFEKLDNDGSGEITLVTLKKVLMENAGAGSLGGLTEEEVEDIFNAMRVRKTETTIQWHEFIAAGLSQCKVDDRNLRLAFDRLDSDHKGYITFENICDLMGLHGTASEEFKNLRKIYFDGLKDCKCDSTRIQYDDFLLLMKGQTREGTTLHRMLATTHHSSSGKLEVVPEDEPENETTNDHHTGILDLENTIHVGMDLDEDANNPIDSPSHNLWPNLSSSSLPKEPSPEDDHLPPTTKTHITPHTDVISLFPIVHKHTNDADSLNNSLHNDESKTNLMVNRNLYRAHRQMRLAVLDASKQFEEEQMKRVFREHVKKSQATQPRVLGAGLVMKHGERKQLSTEEVTKILQEREEEQRRLLEKATRQSGRGRRRRKKTVSDVSAMMMSPEGEDKEGDNKTVDGKPKSDKALEVEGGSGGGGGGIGVAGGSTTSSLLERRKRTSNRSRTVSNPNPLMMMEPLHGQ